MNLLVFLLFLLIAYYCIHCPYTKVEESFALQATHDIIHYRTDISKYDHIEFPGVVPRTFLGSLLLGTLTKCCIALLRTVTTALNRFHEQLIARLILGALVCCAVERFQTAVKTLFGRQASVWFVVLTCCQFHFNFWSSRTLPNTFALPLVLFGLANWLESLTATSDSQTRLNRMIRYLTVAGIVFRFEAGILLCILLVLEWLVYRRISLKTILVQGTTTAVASVALTIGVDSYFWQRWLWPEGVVFYFNAILNKSSEWGTMPFYAYFVLFLPRLLLISYPLAWIAFYLDNRVRRILQPALIYVALFSCLPHKEWRFIVYVIPMMTAAAASLVANITIQSARSGLHRLYLCLILGGMVMSFATSQLMLHISAQNYPGGHALSQLHALESSTAEVSVHLDVVTAMTGASRFGELFHPRWSYHKNESHTDPDAFLEARYTHLITSNLSSVPPDFTLLDVTYGLDKIQLKSPRNYLEDLKLFAKDWHPFQLLLPIRIVTGPKLYTLKIADPQATWIRYTLHKHPIVLYSKTYW